MVLALAVTVFFVRRWVNPAPKSATSSGHNRPLVPATTDSRTTSNTNQKSADPVNRNRGFDRRTSFLEYTRHANCRMECRKISKAEVAEIMEQGSINYSKSDVNAKPCPEYAIEGKTSDGQKVRIVFAQCDFKTKVVTVIDLGKDWSCDCPGDGKKSRQ